MYYSAPAPVSHNTAGRTARRTARSPRRAAENTGFDAWDICGNLFSDTLELHAIPTPVLDLGPDRAVCTGDSITLIINGFNNVDDDFCRARFVPDAPFLPSCRPQISRSGCRAKRRLF